MNIEQEIRAQIEKNKGLKLAVGEINNHLSVLEELVRKDITERVDEAYQKGYDKGYADKTNNDEVGKELAKDVYQRGLDDAWEAARKIVCDDELDWNTLLHIFNRGNFDGIFGDFSPSEAITKLKAYEEQKADGEIKVGDELEHTVSGYTSKAIFLEKIGDDEDWYNCLFWTGCGVAILSYPKSQFKRTGKHFDIDKILAEMRT